MSEESSSRAERRDGGGGVAVTDEDTTVTLTLTLAGAGAASPPDHDDGAIGAPSASSRRPDAVTLTLTPTTLARADDDDSAVPDHDDAIAAAANGDLRGSWSGRRRLGYRGRHRPPPLRRSANPSRSRSRRRPSSRSSPVLNLLMLLSTMLPAVLPTLVRADRGAITGGSGRRHHLGTMLSSFQLDRPPTAPTSIKIPGSVLGDIYDLGRRINVRRLLTTRTTSGNRLGPTASTNCYSFLSRHVDALLSRRRGGGGHSFDDALWSARGGHAFDDAIDDPPPPPPSPRSTRRSSTSGTGTPDEEDEEEVADAGSVVRSFDDEMTRMRLQLEEDAKRQMNALRNEVLELERQRRVRLEMLAAREREAAERRRRKEEEEHEALRHAEEVLDEIESRETRELDEAAERKMESAIDEYSADDYSGEIQGEDAVVGREGGGGIDGGEAVLDLDDEDGAEAVVEEEDVVVESLRRKARLTKKSPSKSSKRVARETEGEAGVNVKRKISSALVSSSSSSSESTSVQTKQPMGIERIPLVVRRILSLVMTALILYVMVEIMSGRIVFVR